MRKCFPLFQSHLDLAHLYWSQLIRVGDTVIDATCGNGHDTLKLCELALSESSGQVYAFDVQLRAIQSTEQLLSHHLSGNLRKRVLFQHSSHEIFPASLTDGTVTLIAYNLGYLPGGEKSLTTLSSSTLVSLRNGCPLIKPGGAISITCYPGHAEGKKEQEEILAFASRLSPAEWSCCFHTWLNRRNAPTLLIIQRSSNGY